MILYDYLVVFLNSNEFLINGIFFEHLEYIADFLGKIIVNIFDATTLLIKFILFKGILELLRISTRRCLFAIYVKPLLQLFKI